MKGPHTAELHLSITEHWAIGALTFLPENDHVMRCHRQVCAKITHGYDELAENLAAVLEGLAAKADQGTLFE
jgi:hypothetical protein